MAPFDISAKYRLCVKSSKALSSTKRNYKATTGEHGQSLGSHDSERESQRIQRGKYPLHSQKSFPEHAHKTRLLKRTKHVLKNSQLWQNIQACIQNPDNSCCISEQKRSDH